MLCPLCQVELKMAERQGVELDYCPKCRGMWLDRGELDTLLIRIERLPPEFDDEDSRRSRRNQERPVVVPSGIGRSTATNQDRRNASHC